jgi:hypothetical protein
MEVYKNLRVYKDRRTLYYLISISWVDMKSSLAVPIVGIVFGLMLLPTSLPLQT